MWLLYLPLVVPALAGVAAHPIAGRLEPPHATWLLTVATVVLAVCRMASLALTGARWRSRSCSAAYRRRRAAS